MKLLDDDSILRCDISLHDMDEDYDPLRGFTADFVLEGETGDQRDLGRITGWVCWRCLDERLADAGDALSGDVHYIAYAAEKILDALLHQEDVFRDIHIEDAVLIDRITIEEEFRGKGHLPDMIGELVNVLRLDVNGCVLVTRPEPQRPVGGPYDHGPVRDHAMAGIHRSLIPAGFGPWSEGEEIWWKLVEARQPEHVGAAVPVEEEPVEDAENTTKANKILYAITPGQQRRAFIEIEAEVVFTDEQNVFTAAQTDLDSCLYANEEEEAEERHLMGTDISSALMQLTDVLPVDCAWDAIEVNATTKHVDRIITEPIPESSPVLYAWWKTFEHYSEPGSNPVAFSSDLQRLVDHVRGETDSFRKNPVIAVGAPEDWVLSYKVTASEIVPINLKQGDKYDDARRGGSRGNLGEHPSAIETREKPINLDEEA
ncbi:hypothetical protein ACTXKY_04755 [Corynebacterium variabile]|uniref:hypothetical protein n=1 Tax=Corynebacterium variabile TaxID=1727 RepID=UPI003FCF6EE4